MPRPVEGQDPWYESLNTYFDELEASVTAAQAGAQAYADAQDATLSADLQVELDAKVTSVNGETGIVTLTAADVGASATGHTHDWDDIGNKPVVVAGGATQAEARTSIGAAADADLTSGLAAKLDSAATASGGLSRNLGATTRVLEVKNSSTGLVAYGVDGADGGPIVNGVKSKLGLHWHTGDPDPTTNGAIDTDAFHYTIHLGLGDSVPAWALDYDGFDVIQETSGTSIPTTVYLFKSDFADVADETAITAGLAGTDDDPVDYLFSADQSVVDATSTPATFPAAARMVRHTAAATTPAIGYVTGGSTTLRIRTFVRTPSSWPGEFSVIAVKQGTGAGSDRIRINIGSTSSPGRIVVKNSANTNATTTSGGVLAVSTDYYFELALTQNATATDGTARLYVYATDGSLVHDTGEFTDGATTVVGFGSDNDRVYFGPVASITTTVYTGRYAATDDPATAIGVS